jgi:hypothetical protein
MKKVSLMVVAVLMSAAMFANSASLPKGKKVNGTTAKTEMKKEHKQKDKSTTKTHKGHKSHKGGKVAAKV